MALGEGNKYYIDEEITFYYKELKNNLIECIEKMKSVCPEATIKELKELIKYAKFFMADVEETNLR
jgi:hypothetical protein